MSEQSTTGRFDIDLTPAEGLLPGSSRFEFEKTWTGGIEGSSRGVMLSAGDPSTGSAGYVAVEAFVGTIEGRHGRLAFQQLGAMHEGEESLTYVIVPGSGTEELAGATGTVILDASDGDHRVTVQLRLP